jgi:MFS family permease
MSAEDSAPSRPYLRGIVGPLAIAETIVWAAIYYVFPALLPAWEADLGWSKTAISGAFTLALVAAAGFSPVAGRLIDRGFGRAVLTGGAAGGAILLALLALVDEIWQFYALWFGLGIAMSGALYQACFALLTHALGDRARRAITLVTLVAGFAGTLAFPSAHALVAAASWRLAVAVFAASVALVAVPLFWVSAGHAARLAHDVAVASSTRTREAMRATASIAFWLIAASFALVALDHGIVTTHILPILAERGVHEEAAVLAAAMIGPMQVAGRLAMMAAERHVSIRAIAVGCDLALAVATALLLAAAFDPGFVVGFVILMGAGIGVNSIVRPVVIAELLGRRNFGLISGLLAMPTTIGYALAPTLAALIWERGGYDLVLVVALAVTLIGLAALLWAWRAVRPTAG